LFKKIEAAFLPNNTIIDSVKQQLIAKFPLITTSEINDEHLNVILETNVNLKNIKTNLNGKIPNGSSLYEYLTSPGNPVLSDQINVESNQRSTLNQVGHDILTWINKQFVTSNYWDSSSLEFKSSVEINEKDSSKVLLNIEKNDDTRLDWYNFDVLSRGSNTKTTSEIKQTRLLTPVSFSGMPDSRFWKFEDNSVDITKFNASKTDIAKSIVAEFALVYGNDWSVIPLSIPYNSITNFKSIIVKDVFGISTKIKNINDLPSSSWQKWKMFNLSVEENAPINADLNKLYLLKVIGEPLESEPVEEVQFVRDEMANMVWAIENLVPSELGVGLNGHEAGLKYYEYIKNSVPVFSNASYENETITSRYQLYTYQAENWIPFVPVNTSSDVNNPRVQLQRGGVPRIIMGVDPERILPRTDLLTEISSPFYINEEEIVPGGITIKTKFKRVRGSKGEVITWKTRVRNVVNLNGSSNLSFDEVLEK